MENSSSIIKGSQIQDSTLSFVKGCQLSIVNYQLRLSITADRLAQLVEYRTTVREVVVSNPGRTTTQGL